jgi:hypothetical protein
MCHGLTAADRSRPVYPNMTSIVTEPIPAPALLAACVCVLWACSAYDGGLLTSGNSHARGTVGSTSHAVDTGLVGGGAPPPRSVVSGEACTSDAECMTGYCVGERCCVEGLCCNQDADCPGDRNLGMACDDTANCQGTRGVLECRERRCVTKDGEPDDRACSPAVSAADCDAYSPVFCTGEVEQEPPTCPVSCERDSECDDDAQCRDGACEADASNGAACERDLECASDHCNAGLCCSDEDCCEDASDCPSGYSAPPACDEPQRCQGTRTVATCIDFSCGSERVADDSACDARVTAADCGSFPDRVCSGSEQQELPECLSSTCSDDSQCDADAYCENGSGCSPGRRDGEACSRDAQCESDHCNGGLCCSEGDCCNRYVCTDPRACRGHVYRRQCNAFRCEEARAPEESSYGCVGQLARVCDAPGYRNVSCYLLPTPYVRECSVCASDAECTWDYECRNNECRLREESAGSSSGDQENRPGS